MRQFQRDFPPTVFSDHESLARLASLITRDTDTREVFLLQNVYRMRHVENIGFEPTGTSSTSNFKMSKLRNRRYLTLCAHEFRDSLFEHARVIITFMIVRKEEPSG